MALIEIEDEIIEIINKENKEDFIYDFLKIYDIPNSTITLLKNGTNNLSKIPGEVHLKNKLYFKETVNDVFEAFIEIESKVNDAVAIPRYLFVTDFKVILAKDTKTGESLDIKFKELPIHFNFFLAWNGIEKVDFEKENPLDIKAAERFARLFDVLNKEIEPDSEEQRHALNLFLMRLLFCLFAEDTNIFHKGQFTNGIKQYTSDDGNNLNDYIEGLFKVLDTQSREKTPIIYKDFPYVNGQLFTEPHQPIKFNKKARKLILECGELLEWSKINPDIFGSMIQAVATEDNRSHLGMHYTSVTNIMKVINPLFLDEVKQQFKEIKDSWNDSFQEIHLGKKKISDTRKKHLDKISTLTNRIKNMKFFDPACGSGNFLIITYKELRQLEIDIYVLINEINNAQMLIYEPIVTLSQFYGIEIDEFASDIAKLSLWIAEHQMNLALKEAVAEAIRPTLPLKSAGDIRCGNALRLDWNEVCPQELNGEVYLFGNPPYLGGKKQDNSHKSDMDFVFSGFKNYRNLDYIAAWFYLGSKYIQGMNSKLAFVSTNSICQGEQVPLLWGNILDYTQIFFTHTQFLWNNNARNKAAVFVVIVGLVDKKQKYERKAIYNSNSVKYVENISPYLSEGSDVIVYKEKKPLFQVPEIEFGSMPRDNGGLILTPEEYQDAIEMNPRLANVIKKYVGSYEFLNNQVRYCIWMNDKQYQEFKDFTFIKQRMGIVRKFRENSKAESTRKAAETPYKFVQLGATKKQRLNNKVTLIIPRVSSENRYYLPMGIIDNETIVSDLAYSVVNAELVLLGILQSKMHMTWMKNMAGRLKADYRYSAGFCYNPFPIPKLSSSRKKVIEEIILTILDIREEYPESLATLYTNGKMPENLIRAHNLLDMEVDKLYKNGIFNSEEERLTTLLKLYEIKKNNG
ncbi:class I SAM-dependent DNA methyltransferase [Enterococcus faecalis]|nr:class I SAM-dependent DNA methyltransferase [Enterococcus faecalis]